MPRSLLWLIAWSHAALGKSLGLSFLIWKLEQLSDNSQIQSWFSKRNLGPVVNKAFRMKHRWSTPESRSPPVKSKVS